MLEKMPLRWRLTVLIVLLLAFCCVGLTVILNFSVGRMASTIEAEMLTPSVQAAQTQPAQSLPGIAIDPVVPAQISQVARQYYLHQSIFYVVIIVGLGGALTYYLSGRALKPLQKLSTKMKSRTVQNLAEKLPVPQSHDEIAELTGSFNTMSQKLDEAFAMQKRFSQSAAHDLRTPLTVMKTKVDVFKKKSKHTYDEYDNLLCVITEQTDRLSDLVKALLNLTNMDALDCKEQLALQPMLSGICEELAEIAQSHSITLSVKGSGQSVYGNHNLLRRAFYNLVENAIQYNTPGGKVDIKVAAANRRSVVTITDTGIGIPAKVQTLVFEPFYRVDKSRSRQMGGAGLGLATVKSIVEMHGGVITLRENPGGGTVFEVTIKKRAWNSICSMLFFVMQLNIDFI